MAWIRFEASLELEIEKKYRLWGTAQPRQPGQIGGTIWPSVKAGPNLLDNAVDMQFPDAFVDELEGSGLTFERR